MKHFILPLMLVSALVFADVLIKSGGVSQGPVKTLDFSSGVSVSRSGSTGLVVSSSAPSNASYITRVSESGLSNEQVLGTLASALLLNTTTTGVLSAYAGTGSCSATSRLSAVSANGTGTCVSMDLTNSVTGVLPEANGGTGATAISCSSGQATTSNGTAYSCTSTLTASDVACAGTCVSDAEISAVATTKLTGTVTNAQLASSYSGVGACTAGSAATTLNANAAPTCTPKATPTACGTGYAVQDTFATSYDCIRLVPQPPTCTGNKVLQWDGSIFTCVCLVGATTTAC